MIAALLWSLCGWGSILSVLFLATAAGKRGAEKRRVIVLQQAAEAEAKRMSALRSFLLSPITPVVPANLVLKPGETCYLQTQAELCTLHKHTYRAGGYAGPSFRIARGVYWRAGGFASAPVTSQGMESDGNGTLYLTSKRFVFVGPAKTVEVPFTKVAAIEPYNDGVRIDVSNKSPIMLLTGSFSLYATFQRVNDGLTNAIPQDQLPDDLKQVTPALSPEAPQTKVQPAAILSYVIVIAFLGLTALGIDHSGARAKLGRAHASHRRVVRQPHGAMHAVGPATNQTHPKRTPH